MNTMSTPPPSAAPSAAHQVSIDRGLRSAQGIRWLLLAGGLVVAVSVIRLVAAEWGLLPTALRFLTLAGGTLALFAAGDVTRRRLCLPVAGSAMLFLATALVPLLSWGAAYLHLLEAPFGWPSLILGLGALLAANDRSLRRLLNYRGVTFTAASGVLLFALPLLSYVEANWLRNSEAGRTTFFLVVAAALGWLLRSASRHINRFFFHRDRRDGVERPVHFLPFALLILLYSATMSLLAAFSTHLAVPLVFIAIALLDAGEEYYQALIRATGERPQRWPQRSRALLTLGFTALAASLAAAPLDAGRQSLALVAAIASWRLITWGGRYGRTIPYTFGLLTSVIAYFAMPALIPDFIRQAFQSVSHAMEVDPGSLAALSLTGLGLIAQLLGLAWLMPRLGKDWQLTPAMRGAQAAITALSASLLLLISLTNPMAARVVGPVLIALLSFGVVGLRWPGLIPALYQALATSAIAWAWHPMLSGGLLSDRAMVWLGAVHLLVLGGGFWALSRWRLIDASTAPSVLRLLTWPPLGVALTLLARALWLSDVNVGDPGIPILVAAETFLGCALLLRHRGLMVAGLASIFVWIPVQAASLGASPTLAAVGWLVFAVGARGLFEVSRHYGHEDLSMIFLKTGIGSGLAAGAASVWATLSTGGSSWLAILPGFLASVFFVFLAVDGHARKLSAHLAMGSFAVSSWALLLKLDSWGPELHCLGPGLALLGLSGLLRDEIDLRWRQYLFTGGATFLYAMPVIGLLNELNWGWQIVLLLFAIGFGASSFVLRSRSLLTVSTAAMVIDLACFLIKLRQTAPLLVWIAGIVFGLSLMAIAALLEHRRELLLQRLRIWGQELRSWA